MDRIHKERETDETLAVLLLKEMEAIVDSHFKCILKVMEMHDELKTIVEGIKKDLSRSLPMDYNEDESSTTNEETIVERHQLMVRGNSESKHTTQG